MFGLANTNRSMCSRPARSRRVALTVAALLCLSGSAAALPPMTIQVVLKEGDTVNGVTVTSVDGASINSLGNWWATVNSFSSTQPQAAIRDGAVVYTEASMVNGPGGSVRVFDWNQTTINDQGQMVWPLLTVPTSGTDSGLFYSETGAAQTEWGAYEGTLAYDEGFGRVATWASFADVKMLSNRRAFMIASVDDFSVQGTINRAIMQATFNADGTLASTIRYATEGDTLTGQTVPIRGSQVTSSQNDANNNGQFIWVPLLRNPDAPTTADEMIYLGTSTELVKEGSPSIIPGRNWGSQSSTNSAVGINDNGDYVYRAALDGATASNAVIVKNGVKFIQKGDPFPPNPAFNVTAINSGSTCVRIDNQGFVWWWADWSDPDANVDTGIMRGNEIVLQEGMTLPGGAVLDFFSTGPEDFSVSRDGKRMACVVTLVGGIEAVVTVSFQDALASCNPADIACDNGSPLVTSPACTNSTTGPNEGDYNAFFAADGFFFQAGQGTAGIGGTCDIACDNGEPPSRAPGCTNNGVNEGDYNCFFNNLFLPCV
ncbi:MAG: hypothetical protein IBJ18_09570 [Phycisphaerales bacterium]|nr:hypothetical protein [Phycisphaerales bacterium]